MPMIVVDGQALCKKCRRELEVRRFQCGRLSRVYYYCLKCRVRSSDPYTKKGQKEQDRQDWNTAMGLFARHFPHVPRMTDDHPLLPADVREHRKIVVAAIMDGIREGRKAGTAGE